MDRNPRGDKLQPGPADSAADQWIRVLAHRQKDAPATVASVIERFDAAGVTPNQVASHLEDGGDRLYAAASSGGADWAVEFGGERAAPLLPAEVSTLMSHRVARAASVHTVCIGALLDEYSAVTVASAIGVARQKVYELARPSVDPDYLTTTPWRNHE